MILHPAGTRPTITADPAYFAGLVRINPIIVAPEPASLRALEVMFSPGGRTNWHSHPRGQTLFVTHGEGRFQTRGEKVQAIRTGDTIFIPPGEEHWHGAAPEHSMTHIAMQEEPGGEVTVWLESVNEADYGAAP